MDETKKPLTRPMPPHARIMALRFDPDGHTLHLRLDEAGEATIDGAAVRRLHLARLHHDDWAAADRYNPQNDEMHHFIVSPTHEDRYQPLLGLKVEGRDEALYLTLDAFNYRDALGDEAEMTGAANRPKLLEKIAGWCPTAVREPGFDAFLAHQAPPVADSLVQFFEHVRG